MWMFICLMLSQKSLITILFKRFLLFKILSVFLLRLCDFHYFVFQLPDLFLGIFFTCCWCLLMYFCFSCSIRQLCLVLSVFSLLNFSLCLATLLLCSLSIFMIVTLNSIVSKSSISTYLSSSRVLYCSFTWNIFLCCLSLPESLSLFLSVRYVGYISWPWRYSLK